MIPRICLELRKKENRLSSVLSVSLLLLVTAATDVFNIPTVAQDVMWFAPPPLMQKPTWCPRIRAISSNCYNYRIKESAPPNTYRVRDLLLRAALHLGGCPHHRRSSVCACWRRDFAHTRGPHLSCALVIISVETPFSQPPLECFLVHFDTLRGKRLDNALVRLATIPGLSDLALEGFKVEFGASWRHLRYPCSICG